MFRLFPDFGSKEFGSSYFNCIIHQAARLSAVRRIVFRDLSPIDGFRDFFSFPQELYQPKPGTVLPMAW